jgi:hypothetical protein
MSTAKENRCLNERKGMTLKLTDYLIATVLLVGFAIWFQRWWRK